MQPNTPIRPSAWYFWLAPLFLAAGLGVVLMVVSRGLPRLSEALTQVVVPGQATLNLRPGKHYSVYYERRSKVSEKVYNTDEALSGLRCELDSLDGDDVVALQPAGGSATYAIGGRSGSTYLEFSVAHEGPYRFTCAYEKGVHGRDVVLAVGYGLGALFLKPILLMMLGCIGGMALATISFYWVYILRDQAVARAAAERLLPS